MDDTPDILDSSQDVADAIRTPRPEEEGAGGINTENIETAKEANGAAPAIPTSSIKPQTPGEPYTALPQTGEPQNSRAKIVGVILVVLAIIAVGGAAIAVTIINNTATNEVVSNDIELTSGTVTTTIGGKSVTYKAAYVVDGVEATISSGAYESSNDDENVFLVINGGKLTITGASIMKTGSEGFNGRGDDYSFYGTNSAVVVVGEGSEVLLDDTTINTRVGGANAVVATNGGKATVENATIATTEDNSRGLHATYAGEITANNVRIATGGGSCAALATDRGNGTVTATNMILGTAGAGSPLIYSTGSITVRNSTGTAEVSQIAVIEGKNEVVIESSDFSAAGIGNRGVSMGGPAAGTVEVSEIVDNAGIMIYQSMSGDSEEGLGVLMARDSKFAILSDSVAYNAAPFFFITNTAASVTLENVTLSFSPVAAFAKAAGTSAWGRSGSNGGNATFNLTDVTATNMTMEVDGISSIVSE